MAKAKKLAPIVEREDSMKAATPEVVKHYEEQMIRMFGNASVPAVFYKGRTISAGQLGRTHYLTSTPEHK